MVVQDVLSGESFNPVDRPVLNFLVVHREPWLTHVATAVSALGSSAVLVPLLVAVGLWWRWRRGTWRPAAVLGTGYGGAVALYELIKVVVGRPRPPLAAAVHHFSDYTFPSGHAAQAIVGLGDAGRARRRGHAAMVEEGSGVDGSPLVAATRLYLGAHWFTDVAGLVLGALWLSALLT